MLFSIRLIVSHPLFSLPRPTAAYGRVLLSIIDTTEIGDDEIGDSHRTAFLKAIIVPRGTLSDV